MLLSQSSHVAVTEHRRLGGLSNKHFVLTVLEAGSRRSGHQQGLVLVKDPPPEFADGHLFAVYSGNGEQREKKASSPSLYLQGH